MTTPTPVEVFAVVGLAGAIVVTLLLLWIGYTEYDTWRNRKAEHRDGEYVPLHSRLHVVWRCGVDIIRYHLAALYLIVKGSGRRGL